MDGNPDGLLPDDVIMMVSGVVAEDGLYVPGAEVVELLRKVADKWAALELLGTPVLDPANALRQYADGLDLRMMQALTEGNEQLAALAAQDGPRH